VLHDLQRGGVMATHLCHIATFDCEQPIKTKKKRKSGHVETMRGRKERRSRAAVNCIACVRPYSCPRNAMHRAQTTRAV
jgi:hypothetical protein